MAARVWERTTRTIARVGRARNEPPRRRSAIEPAGMFTLIMLDIWLVEPRVHMMWLSLLGLAIASHARLGETPAYLGFGRANLGRCFAAVAPLLLGIGALAIVLGATLGTVRPFTPARLVPFILYYCVWGVVQQYALNGYFVNRFAAAAAGRGRGMASVPVVAAGCFAAAHVPNWFLAGVTLAMGWISARLYLRYRNLYPLGIAHGLLGTVLYFTVPDAMSLHFHVGPGAIRWQQLRQQSGSVACATLQGQPAPPTSRPRPAAACDLHAPPRPRARYIEMAHQYHHAGS